MAPLLTVGVRTLSPPRPPSAAGFFDAALKYSGGNSTLFWQFPFIFSQQTTSPFIINVIVYSCGELYMMVEKYRLLVTTPSYNNSCIRPTRNI